MSMLLQFRVVEVLHSQKNGSDCAVGNLHICDPLCEIQAKVSKSNYEKTSIKVWFLRLISKFDMTLLNIKDTKAKFSQKVLYHMKDDVL